MIISRIVNVYYMSKVILIVYKKQFLIHLECLNLNICYLKNL